MKDIKSHKASMGLRAWKQAAIRRRGQYGDILTIEQIRKDTNAPNEIPDEIIQGRADVHTHHLKDWAPTAPPALINEAVILMMGFRWEMFGAITPDTDAESQLMEESGAAYLLYPYAPDRFYEV